MAKERGMSFKNQMVSGILRNIKRQTRRLNKGKFDFEVGDIMYVKEALRKGSDTGFVKYQTTDDFVYRGEDEQAELVGWEWKPLSLPAMYCPKWASRIKCIITSVRVERLHDITDEDALLEGIELIGKYYRVKDWPGVLSDTPRGCYISLWEHINGKGSSALNPEVIVYNFEKIND